MAQTDGNGQELSQDDTDLKFMLQACDLSWRSNPVASAYCVGCVIVTKDRSTVLSTGYSRELPGNTHAEECALAKLEVPDGSPTAEQPDVYMYTTMEPCSKRVSGNSPCVARILATRDSGNSRAGCKVIRVYVGAMEPSNFVNCEGYRILREAGVEMVLVQGPNPRGLVWDCLHANNHIAALHPSGADQEAIGNIRVRPYRPDDDEAVLPMLKAYPEMEAYARAVLADMGAAGAGIVGVYVAEDVVPDDRKTQAARDAPARIAGVSVVREEVWHQAIRHWHLPRILRAPDGHCLPMAQMADKSAGLVVAYPHTLRPRLRLDATQRAEHHGWTLA